MARRFVVRYGAMRHLGEFGAADLKEGGRPVPLRRGDGVVVKTGRGTELGEVLCEATERTRRLLERPDSTGVVLRLATDLDRQKRDDLWRRAEDAFAGAAEEVRVHGLNMQLVDVEYLLGGEILTFFYTAEARVDFRELVKALAKRFKTRIEMRHIGVRDEAKLLADYGDCGKPVCCNTHLRKMPPVSMKMAKLQKASLDPDKLSGRCGRLKCCLRYEFDTYEEHRKELPKAGKWVVTKEGTGKVVAQEILAKKVLLAMEDGRRVIAGPEDVLTVVSAPDRNAKPLQKKEGGRKTKAPDPAAGSGEKPAKPKRKRRRRRRPKSGGDPSNPAGGS